MGWINVQDRLPVKHGDYLVFTDRIEILRFEGEVGHVKYWMDLPEVPNEMDRD